MTKELNKLISNDFRLRLNQTTQKKYQIQLNIYNLNTYEKAFMFKRLITLLLFYYVYQSSKLSLVRRISTIVLI